MEAILNSRFLNLIINKIDNMINSSASPFLNEKQRDFVSKSNYVNESLKQKLNSNINLKEKEILEYGFDLTSNIYLKSGDVIYRPLSFLKDDLSMQLNHYGIVFGKMKNGDCLILENSDKTNVSFKTLSEFCEPHSINKIKKEQTYGTPLNVVLRRAKEVEHDTYSATDFNCRHFVNYCIYGKKTSEQVVLVKNILMPALNIMTHVLTLVECDNKNSVYLKSIQDFRYKLDLVINNISKKK